MENAQLVVAQLDRLNSVIDWYWVRRVREGARRARVLPEERFESELFGYEKGAHATADRAAWPQCLRAETSRLSW